jgi:hypothetical protein
MIWKRVLYEQSSSLYFEEPKVPSFLEVEFFIEGEAPYLHPKNK